MNIQKSTIFLLFSPSFASGATSLAAGDIAFLGHNLDGADEYAFILLADIDATTTINFTDRGWNDGAGFFTATGEGACSWTSGAPLNAGTVVRLGVNGPGLSSSTGSTALITSPVFSGLGDQVFAYHGDGSLGTLIAGLHNNALGGTTAANWDGSSTNNQTSALPDTFTNGDQAIWLNNGGGEVDNWCYNATSASSFTGTPAEIRAQLHDVANWSNDNLSSLDMTPANFGTFNVILIPEPSSTTLLLGFMTFALTHRPRK